MLARAYFQLMDAIAAAHSETELSDLRVRIDATDMHPFERKALERQVRARELALRVELELKTGLAFVIPCGPRDGPAQK
jgi:hypothetical protein